MKAHNKLENSWEIALLEDYLGDYAHFFKYDGGWAKSKVFNRGGDTSAKSFYLELIYHNTEEGDAKNPNVVLYIQPIEGDVEGLYAVSDNILKEDDEQEIYLAAAKVHVSEPNSQEKMEQAVANLFQAFGLEERVKKENE